MRESTITRSAKLEHPAWKSTAEVVERSYVLSSMPHPWAEITVTVQDGCQYTHIESSFEGAVNAVLGRGYVFQEGD